MAGAGTLEAVEALGWGWSQAEAPRTTRRTWLWRGVSALGWLASAIAVMAVIGFFVFVYSLERVESRPEARTDGIVALTGGSERIGDAIDLLAQGFAGRLLISGVNERTSRASIARLNPGQQRLLECCVDLDYRARNTIGNAIETRRWMETHRFRSLIVVTSNYHMPRTLVELDHAMPGVRKVAYAVTGAVDPDDWWHSPATARILLSEYIKFLVVWTRTRFEGDPERSRAAVLLGGGRKPVKQVAEPLFR